MTKERLPALRAKRKFLDGAGTSNKSQATEQSSSNPLKRKRPTPSPSVLESASGSDSDDEHASSGNTSSSSDVPSDHPISELRKVPLSKHPECNAPTAIRYEPPPNFSPAKISNVSPSLLNAFNPELLRGKQIWQISVPASVPIDSITSVRMTSVTDGSPILTHDGTEYCLSIQSDGTMEGEMIMLPNAEKNKYLSAKGVKSSRSLRVQEIMRKPRMPLPASDDAMDVEFSAVVHEQPKGLKMRYRPFGDFDSDSEDGGRMQDVQPTRAVFRRPNIPNGTPSVAEEREKSVDKLAKKVRKEERLPVAHQPSPTTMQEDHPTVSQDPPSAGLATHAVAGSNDPTAPLSARKKHRKSERDIFEVASDHGSSRRLPANQPLSSSEKQHETAEEKAKRREERRKRKAMRENVEGTIGVI